MYLQRLSLIDFKNVGEAQIELSPQINCMVGDNGTGKTNLLDAVHYLSMCKSAFGLSDTQCVRHGSEAFLVDGRYGERQIAPSVSYARSRKEAKRSFAATARSTRSCRTTSA